jgi:hypothetical protein
LVTDTSGFPAAYKVAEKVPRTVAAVSSVMITVAVTPLLLLDV